MAFSSSSLRSLFADRIPIASAHALSSIAYQYQVDAGSATVVTAVVGPGPSAQHSSTMYVPDHEYQEQEIGVILGV